MSTSPRKRPASDALVAGGVVVLLIAIVGLVFWSGAGSTLYPPRAVTAEGREISKLYDIVFALAVAIFIAVEGLIVWSIIRYRRRPTDVDLPPQTHGNNLVEALWTLIPTVIVLYLFAISWNTLNTVDAVTEGGGEVNIHVIAGQFQWQFEYRDKSGSHIATETRAVAGPSGGGMAVPVGKKVQVTLTSVDVIHAWYVPKFLFKRDVVPGQTGKFEFTVDESEAGQIFHGQCAELCGAGHRIMLFNVVAMTPTDFEAYLDRLVEAENATAPPAPSGAPVLELTGKLPKFDKASLDAPADGPFVIHFKNDDIPALTHDVDVKDGSGTVVSDQNTIAGGETQDYTYTPLAAGTYTFFCSIHANMTGTLTVQ